MSINTTQNPSDIKMTLSKEEEETVSNVDTQSPPVEPTALVMYHGFATDLEHIPKAYFRSSYFLGTYIAHCFTFLGGLAGFNLISPILGHIDADIGPSPNLIWVAIVYILGLAVGIGLVGRITDITGRRWFMIVGNLFGVVGAIICSRAQNINTLIAGETLIGVGATAAYCFNFVISEIVPMKYRFMALGGLFIFTLPTNGFNTVIATAFILHTEQGWRWCYYFMLIINVIATVLYFVCYHPPTFQEKHQTQSKMEVVKNFDYIGATALLVGVTLVVIGLNWGGNLYTWDNAHTVATIVVGGVVLVVFLPIWSLSGIPKDPFLPKRIFTRGWTVSCLSSSVGATVYYSFTIIWPSMVTNVFANGDLYWAGWASCLVTMGIVIGEIIANFFTLIVTRQKTQCIVVMLVGTVFLGLMGLVGVNDKGMAMAFVLVSTTFIGWNEAITATLVTVCITDQGDIGLAAGLSGCIRAIFGTVSAAIYSAVLRSRLNQTIPARVPAAVIDAGLPETSVPQFIQSLSLGGLGLDNVPGINQAIIEAGTYAYRVANVEAYRTVFFASLAFAGGCVILNFWLPDVDELMGDDIAVTLHVNKELDSEKVAVGNNALHKRVHA